MSRLNLIIVCVAVLVLAPVHSQLSGSQSKDVHTATEIRLMDPGWWPTKGAAARDEYVGSAACAQCHADKAESQKNTAMAHALMTADSAVPNHVLHGPLEFRVGSYNYQVAQTATGAVYSVSNGSHSVSVPLSWAFGNTEFGQTYMFEQNGSFYESRISYYRAPQALDFTIGNPRSAPGNLDTALGRRIYPDEARRCFSCHSTAATTSNRFDAKQLIPGITCEGCHGPGAQHVVEMNLEADGQTPSLIMNPARLGPVDSVEFCGACHRTSVDAALSGVTGVYALRFPAYRLERSRCWRTGDARLTCVACHDPHSPSVRDATYYDNRCLSCHVATSRSGLSHDHPGMACRAGQKASCVTCHMPKYSIPEMHTAFTDHKISIHREGRAFTD
jgi:hypothetical protein